ncbi:MAG: TIGR04086 family membrane protein [Oscillospiraceae bacterium]|nr:TIGR04086 family membrane protein [Oscillospiraceae bacterium]
MLRRLRPVFIGTAFGILCCLVVLLLFALLMAACDIPQAAVTPMAVIAAAVGAFFGGFICAKAAGSRGLIYGAACGGLMYLLILIAGFSLLSDVRGWYALIKLLVVVTSAAIGGVYGVNFRRRK